MWKQGREDVTKPSWLNAYGNLLIQGHRNGNSPITFDFRALAATFPCRIECRSILALSHLLTPILHLCLQPPLVVKGSARSNFFLPSSLQFSTHQLLIVLGKHPLSSPTGPNTSLDPTPSPLHGDGRESTQLRSLIPTNAMLPGRRIQPSSPTWTHSRPHHLADLPRNSTPASWEVVVHPSWFVHGLWIQTILIFMDPPKTNNKLLPLTTWP